ncbi:MAG: hypothetical protein KIH01_00415 [Candidatus Freyarchaeota archaeon]|nr:hypothetical protein [Candidatus Jordarchaeia archaeon]
MSGELSRFRIRFLIEGVGEAEGELNRLKAPLTVEALLNALPITSSASVWQGREVYFPVGIKKGAEKAKKKVEVGEIAYWPMGDALCIFYDEIKPYSEVNPVGRVVRGLELFRHVRQGTRIRVERVEK